MKTIYTSPGHVSVNGVVYERRADGTVELPDDLPEATLRELMGSHGLVPVPAEAAPEKGRSRRSAADA